MLLGRVSEQIEKLAESGIFFDKGNTLKLFGVETLGEMEGDLDDLLKALESAGDLTVKTGGHRKNYA